MLYGHIEEPRHRVDHVLRLRELQDETGGFAVFIPLRYQHDFVDSADGKIRNRLQARTTMASPAESLKTFAVSRLLFDNVPHVKCFWVMHGLSVAQLSLNFGVDDLDGSVVEYKITHDADSYGTPTTMHREDLLHLIWDAGFRPVERNTRYEVVREYDAPPLAGRAPRPSRRRSGRRPATETGPRVPLASRHGRDGATAAAQTFPRRDAAGRVASLAELVVASRLGPAWSAWPRCSLIEGVLVPARAVRRSAAPRGWLAAILPASAVLRRPAGLARARTGVRGRAASALGRRRVGRRRSPSSAGLAAGPFPPLVSGADRRRSWLAVVYCARLVSRPAVARHRAGPDNGRIAVNPALKYTLGRLGDPGRLRRAGRCSCRSPLNLLVKADDRAGRLGRASRTSLLRRWRDEVAERLARRTPGGAPTTAARLRAALAGETSPTATSEGPGGDGMRRSADPST